MQNGSVSYTEIPCWKWLKIPHASVSNIEQFCTPSNQLSDVRIMHCHHCHHCRGRTKIMNVFFCVLWRMGQPQNHSITFSHSISFYHYITFSHCTTLSHLHFQMACKGFYWYHQLELSWYLHQPETHQLSQQNITDGQTPGPIDRTPGIHGSDKNLHFIMTSFPSVACSSLPLLRKDRKT